MKPKECSICLQAIYFKQKKLACKHTFHKKCIKEMFKTTDRRSCPLCMKHIMAKPETKLLTATTTESIDNIYTLHESKINPNELIIEAMKHGNIILMSYLLSKVDLNKVITELIDSENIDLVKLLITTNKINFHATKNGQTLIDRVHATKNRELINVILNYCGFQHFNDQPSLYPKLPSAPLLY